MQRTTRAFGDGLWLYFGLTFAVSWAVWLAAIASGMQTSSPAGALLFVLGGSAPSVVGVILLYRFAPPAERSDFWRRLINFRSIQPAWYALILLGLPGVVLLGIVVSNFFGGAQPGYTRLMQIGAQPLLLIPLIIQGIVTGPLLEELGWRGFALDRMAQRWGLLAGSVVLGGLWWAWHLPLFFFKGPLAVEAQWGWGSTEFWLFAPSILALSVLTAWAYAHNHRSLLAAILIHFVYNFTPALVAPMSATVRIYIVLFQCLLAVSVVMITRKAAAPTSLYARPA